MASYAAELERLRLEADECAAVIAEANRQVFWIIADQSGMISSKNDSQLIALHQRLREKMDRWNAIIDEAESLRVTHSA